MKMKNLIIILAAIAVVGLSACKDLTELNVDKKRPSIVSSASLISNAQKVLVDRMTSTNVNNNSFRLWAEFWAQTQYPDESNFELTERNINGRLWNTLYVNVIGNLREAKRINSTEPGTDTEKAAQAAIADVLEVYAWHILVDVFGSAPYTAAFSEELTPKYDTGDFIYGEISKQLDNAIANLGNDSGLGTADLIYGGDSAAWKRFANSLKLRMGIRLADGANVSEGQRMVEEAFASGVILSNDQNVNFNYLSSPPNTNPLWVDLVQSGRNDFVGSNTLIDYMNNLNDPRIGKYFEDNLGAGVYEGGVFGSGNSFAGFSHVSPTIKDPEFPGSLFNAAEVHFLLADAAERGFNVAGNAEAHYNMGVTASFLEWGLDEAAATTYLGTSDVAYSSAPGTWKEKIAMQKWLALYNRGFEAWSTYRLYDAPVMNVAADAEMTPPSRWIFPNTEYSLNEVNLKAAAATLGGDSPTTKVFWDKQ